MSIIEQLRILSEIGECGIGLENTKRFNISELSEACKRVKKLSITEYLKKQFNLEVQKELIQNPDFADYYIKLCGEGLSNHQIGELVYVMHIQSELLTDYPVQAVIDTEALELPDTTAVYEYLKYFYPIIKSEEERLLVAGNIRYFYHQNELQINQLKDAERSVLLSPYFQSLHFEGENIETVLHLVFENKALQTILKHLSDRDIHYFLGAIDLANLQYLQPEDIERIQKLMNVFNNSEMTRFIERWLKNKALKYDLEKVAERCENYSKEEKDELLDTQIGYLNTIYSGELRIPFEELAYYQRDVLIYAIGHKANTFLRLVSENQELFLKLDSLSMIYDEEFYKRCNLNSLTLKNLKSCQGDRTQDSCLYLLDEKEYTFEELKCLRYVRQDYIELYNRLNIKRVDDKLIVIRQLLKRDLLPSNMTEEQLAALAGALSVKPLSLWMEKEFANILELKARDAVRVLLVYDKIKHFFPDMHTWEEAVYAARNADRIQHYNRWTEVQQKMLNNDDDWNYLVEKMGFSDEFVKENLNHIIHFLACEGAEMTRTYYDYTEKKDAFRRIVQAELMGQFHMLKYFKDDLQKEIDFPIKQIQQKCWESNVSRKSGDFQIIETDDFYTTLRLGTLPHHTCLAYYDGAHRDCLLSGYDSNKKILLAMRGGEVVARAVVRLTKGAFQMPRPERNKSSLEFVDLMANEDSSINPNKDVERLTLFLERPYFSGINETEAEKIKAAFVSLVQEKAKSMNAVSVLSLLYASEFIVEQYARVGFYLYISKSKGGAQYLDSLSGPAVSSKEGSYEKNLFLVIQDEVIN